MKTVEKEILKYYFNEFWNVINHEDYDWSYDYSLSNLHPEPEKNKELNEIFNIEYLKILNETQKFNQVKSLLKKFMVEVRNSYTDLSSIDFLRINLSTIPFIKYDNEYVLYSFRLNKKKLKDANKLFKKLLELFKIIQEDEINIFALWLQFDDLKYSVDISEKDDIFNRCVFSTSETDEKISSNYIIRKKSVK